MYGFVCSSLLCFYTWTSLHCLSYLLFKILFLFTLNIYVYIDIDIYIIYTRMKEVKNSLNQS